MDHQSTLVASVKPPRVEQIDQAVFTSIRSPMARGYRIVAASAGLVEDEKREIVQRAPSHGNLCDGSAHAQAQAGFPLRSGRYCLLFSHHAGPEPSGRGGLRVHTHALVLATSLYRQFRCDPLRVELFARSALASNAQGPKSPALAPIPVAVKPGGIPAPSADAAALDATSADDVIPVALALLTARRTIIAGAPSPDLVLRAVLAATPLGVRRALSFACGMKFSTQRDFQLLFYDEDARQLESIAGDRAYAIVEWGSRAELTTSAFASWLGFVREEWGRDRGRYLRAIVCQLDDECSPEALARVVALASDARAARTLDADELLAVRAKWLGCRPTGPVQRRLLRRIDRLVTARLAEFEQDDSGEAGMGGTGREHPN